MLCLGITGLVLGGAGGGTPDIIAPTLLTATVEDADPLRINLVWSEAMSSTISAAAAFAISAGHTVTAHTLDTSTTSHLTITTSFVNGEAARTLAYTQPGSNKMQDVAGNLLANIAAKAITNNVAATRITFTDTFTGADASAPNVRWTGDQAGWEINTNHLRFTGGVASSIFATCTAGDNTIDVDTDFSAAGLSFAAFYCGYIGGSKGVYAQLDASEVLNIHQVVAGVDTVVATDTGHTRLGTAAHIKVALVGTLCTVTVTGGVDPGTFSGTVAAGALGGTSVGVFMNTSKTVDFFDNFVLS